MKLSATLKSGTGCSYAGAAEVSGVVLFSELHANNPKQNTAVINDLIF
jgi:hypothetical protein